ncbi:MAG: vWA domain-containing protein [Bacteroidota bacterium]
MQAQTILLLVVALLVALGLACFQYYKKGEPLRKHWVLVLLRCIGVFTALLLLINPEYTKTTYSLEKPSLTVLLDNSASIKALEADIVVGKVADELSKAVKLKERFDINTYPFASTIQPLDSLDFSQDRTDITNSLKTLTEAQTGEKGAVILVTDGNQTYGEDYEFQRFGVNNTQIYPLVVGDTATYQDVRIGQVNSNRYAFLNNQFPVEAQIVYAGNEAVNTTFTAQLDGKTVHRENISLSATDRTKTIVFSPRARATGIKPIQLNISPLTNEKNQANNQRLLNIEVIDEKTKVGVITTIQHPDLGMLKKAIESNPQREVLFLKPTASQQVLESLDVFIFYQPNRSFAPAYQFVEKRGGGIFTILGPEADWSLLAQGNSGISWEGYGEREEILATKNEGFGLFDISNFVMEGFPPLSGVLGQLQFSTPANIIAYQRIQGVNLESPLFFTLDNDQKAAYLLGANIWKWRLQAYRNEGNFEAFDEFLGRLVFWLSSSDKKERLQLTYEAIYQSANEAIIQAPFFDKTYLPDTEAQLEIKIDGVGNGFSRITPMLRVKQGFKVDLSDLKAGNYTFTVSEKKESIAKSGRFTILDFDMEKQWLSADANKLERLANANAGQVYYPDQTEQLINDLMDDTAFVPIQKSTKNVVSLIDFQWLLAFMILAFATEWIIRKYNGLL